MDAIYLEALTKYPLAHSPQLELPQTLYCPSVLYIPLMVVCMCVKLYTINISGIAPRSQTASETVINLGTHDNLVSSTLHRLFSDVDIMT